jgi:hypothetical protein
MIGIEIVKYFHGFKNKNNCMMFLINGMVK